MTSPRGSWCARHGSSRGSVRGLEPLPTSAPPRRRRGHRRLPQARQPERRRRHDARSAVRPVWTPVTTRWKRRRRSRDASGSGHHCHCHRLPHGHRAETDEAIGIHRMVGYLPRCWWCPAAATETEARRPSTATWIEGRRVNVAAHPCGRAVTRCRDPHARPLPWPAPTTAHARPCSPWLPTPLCRHAALHTTEVCGEGRGRRGGGGACVRAVTHLERVDGHETSCEQTVAVAGCQPTRQPHRLDHVARRRRAVCGPDHRHRSHLSGRHADGARRRNGGIGSSSR